MEIVQAFTSFVALPSDAIGVKVVAGFLKELLIVESLFAVQKSSCSLRSIIYNQY